jgi:hypothetical protein
MHSRGKGVSLGRPARVMRRVFGRFTEILDLSATPSLASFSAQGASVPATVPPSSTRPTPHLEAEHWRRARPRAAVYWPFTVGQAEPSFGRMLPRLPLRALLIQEVLAERAGCSAAGTWSNATSRVVSVDRL